MKSVVRDLKSNDLKRLVIRLDYIGVMDIERVIKYLRESFILSRTSILTYEVPGGM